MDRENLARTAAAFAVLVLAGCVHPPFNSMAEGDVEKAVVDATTFRLIGF